MIPYPYKFVDFAGTDLSGINGLTVSGIYRRIIDAVNRCGEVVLYNWYFASIPIAPSYCSIEVGTGYIIVNDVIEIRDDDTVWVESLIPTPPEPPVLVQLTVTENGEYDPEDYNADGFGTVDVEVPGPLLYDATFLENGEYTPPDGYDGFGTVQVFVSPVSYPTVQVTIEGGYNGGAILTVAYDFGTLLVATGNSPYNLSYTPNSASVPFAGKALQVAVPTLPNNTSQLVVNVSWGDDIRSVSFSHNGQNTSYGYTKQVSTISFEPII